MMDESLWGAGVICVILYGNLKVFRSYAGCLFWATCYDSVKREIRRRHAVVMYPFLLLLSLFPVIVVAVLPTVILAVCSAEVSTYVAVVMDGLEKDKRVSAYVQAGISEGLKKILELLDIQPEEHVYPGLIWEKVLKKAVEYADEILGWTSKGAETVGHLIIFSVVAKYFSTLRASPAYYVLRPTRKCVEMASSFEGIVYTLFLKSVICFLLGALNAYIFGCPLLVCSGAISSLLSVFPVFPSFLYALPLSLYAWTQGRPLAAGCTLGVSVVQQVITNKICGFDLQADIAQTVGIPAGLQALGLPGAVLGPFLVSALMSVWPEQKIPVSTRARLGRAQQADQKKK